MSEVIHIWRQGCIIRSDFIADRLQPIYAASELSDNEPLSNILLSKSVAGEVLLEVETCSANGHRVWRPCAGVERKFGVFQVRQ